MGDLLGDWKALNTFVNKKKPSAIIQVGDFGYWPKFNDKTTLGDKIYTARGIKKTKWYQCGMKMQDTKLFWCDGNHEDHWSLKQLRTDRSDDIIYEVCTNVFYVPRMTVLKTTDNKNILFVGGANSIDKQYRTIGVDWFPSEVITQKDLYNLPDCTIDIVISHTCPREFLHEILKQDFRKFNDPCYDALSFILQTYKPDNWFFGHFHHNKKGSYANTNWYCLNMAVASGWFLKY
jgi:hypothetical protein